MALGGLLHGEERLAIRIHVLEPCRGEMREIVLLHWEALTAEAVEYRLHVDSIPDHHRVGDEVKTHRLVSLGFLLFAADYALVRHEEKIAQRMQGFAFIELGIDPPPIVLTLQIAQDKERFHQTAIFLQGTGEDILPGIRLELTNEERGRHPAELERAREPQEVLPMAQDEVLLDDAFEPGCQVADLLLPGDPVELLIPNVA